MIYAYLCPACQKEVDIVKHHSESSKEEACPNCLHIMERVFTPTMITMKNWEPQYNPAFGKVIHNRRELKEHLATIKGETGKTYVEVGTDTLKSVKKTFKKYEV